MILGTEVGLSRGDFVLDRDPAKRGRSPLPIFGPFLLWPNRWMHQDATWYGDRPQPSGLCVTWRLSAPSPKRGGAPQIFGPCLLWPNGWMDQDSTWYGDRPQSRRLCVRWGRSPSPNGGRAPTQFSAHFYCGQTAGCITMPLGMKVGISPGDFVFDGDPAPPLKKGGGAPPIFCPCLLRPNGCNDQDATWYRGWPRPRRYCVR